MDFQLEHLNLIAAGLSLCEAYNLIKQGRDKILILINLFAFAFNIYVVYF